MIVVLDTNIVISAALSPAGVPARIFELWEADEFEVAVSEALLDELERALRYDKVKKHIRRPEQTIDALVDRIRRVAITANALQKIDVIEKDPADNRVLECAVAAHAAYIVSGDKHLLQLQEYRGIIILRPAGFLALVTPPKNK